MLFPPGTVKDPALRTGVASSGSAVFWATQGEGFPFAKCSWGSLSLKEVIISPGRLLLTGQEMLECSTSHLMEMQVKTNSTSRNGPGAVTWNAKIELGHLQLYQDHKTSETHVASSTGSKSPGWIGFKPRKCDGYSAKPQCQLIFIHWFLEGMFYLSCLHLSPSVFRPMLRTLSVCELPEAFVCMWGTIFLIGFFLVVFLCFSLCSVPMPFRLIWIALSFNSTHLEESLILTRQQQWFILFIFLGLCPSSGLFIWKAKQEMWSGWFSLLAHKRILTWLLFHFCTQASDAH